MHSVGLSWSPVISVGCKWSLVVSGGLCWFALFFSGHCWSSAVSANLQHFLVVSSDLCLVSSGLHCSPVVSSCLCQNLLVSSNLFWCPVVPMVSASLEWSLLVVRDLCKSLPVRNSLCLFVSSSNWWSLVVSADLQYYQLVSIDLCWTAVVSVGFKGLCRCLLVSNSLCWFPAGFAGLN